MCSTADFEYGQSSVLDRLTGSGNWTLDEVASGGRAAPKCVRPGFSLPQLARLALLVAISSVSSGLDPWLQTRQRRSPLTLTSTFQTSTRRRITPSEARRMALEILHRAEAERAAIAFVEARQGIDWEEVVL